MGAKGRYKKWLKGKLIECGNLVWRVREKEESWVTSWSNMVPLTKIEKSGRGARMGG